MTNAGADLFANWVLLLFGLWFGYTYWPNPFTTVLAMIIVCAPMIIDRIPRQR
jgi:hypothetical protein